jgi:hypothetical protein
MVLSMFHKILSKCEIETGASVTTLPEAPQNAPTCCSSSRQRAVVTLASQCDWERQFVKFK